MMIILISRLKEKTDDSLVYKRSFVFNLFGVAPTCRVSFNDH